MGVMIDTCLDGKIKLSRTLEVFSFEVEKGSTKDTNTILLAVS